jgi:hypothetical protein
MHFTRSVLVKFIPAQNRFNAKNQICMWVSSDPNAKVPTGDAAIRQQCLSAGGETFHSEFTLTKIFRMPPSQYKNFSTGQGDNAAGGTPFEPQGRLIIVPLGGSTEDWQYGTITLQFSTRLSGPGTNLSTTTNTIVTDPWTENKWLNVDSDFQQIWRGLDPNSYVSVYTEGVVKIYSASNANSVFPYPSDGIKLPAKYYISTTDDAPPAPEGTTPTAFTHYTYDPDTSTWVVAEFLKGLRVTVMNPIQVTNTNLGSHSHFQNNVPELPIHSNSNLSDNNFKPLITQNVSLTNPSGVPINTNVINPDDPEEDQILTLDTSVLNVAKTLSQLAFDNFQQLISQQNGNLLVNVDKTTSDIPVSVKQTLNIQGVEDGTPVPVETINSDSGFGLDDALGICEAGAAVIV